jgi:CO/xanthine dehydrogenase Mo-binding subunit
VTGRGVACTFRSQTVVAEMAEVEFNRATGRIWVKRIVCAYDCGLVINPEALVHTVENGLLHGISRAIYEEVKFDTAKVTSVDWITYPTLRHDDVPASIEVVLVNGDPNPKRPDLPPYGAGETMLKPTMAVVANALFDATGERIRRIPLMNRASKA